MLNLDNKKINPNKGNLFDGYLIAVAYVILSTYQQTHGYSPEQFVLGCEMFLPVKHKIKVLMIIIKTSSE